MQANALLSGAIIMAALTIALFFLRFWRQTRDRFFLYFALAFVLEALQRLLSANFPLSNPDVPMYYLLRLAAYGLIIVAILGKNRRPPGD
ncbi:DUF5985 family protein [Pseudoduganella namucuonensis]|uniref:Uncharacterized protein n=1 Tax=Pseudoduganella namucuonensis TaxID=1035707 RepID=A0A1I7L9E5_9BURK|nr:DUF5985 family protein [Pseudoduganella namucuonensis]SFV06321.1 hypothetical protein SAMN05216552_102523 [Pseudoduganella namucuonensis]